MGCVSPGDGGASVLPTLKERGSTIQSPSRFDLSSKKAGQGEGEEEKSSAKEFSC